MMAYTTLLEDLSQSTKDLVTYYNYLKKRTSNHYLKINADP